MLLNPHNFLGRIARANWQHVLYGRLRAWWNTIFYPHLYIAVLCPDDLKLGYEFA